MLNIKILGSGCPNCKRLEARVRDVLADMGAEAKVEDVTDMKGIMAYGIMATPGLVIEGEVKSSGRIPSKEEISGWISAAQPSA